MGLIPTEKQLIKVESVCAEIFDQLLQFLYTDNCDLLTVGKTFDLADRSTGAATCRRDSHPGDLLSENAGFHGNKVSAFEVHQKKNKRGKSKGKGTGEKAKSSESGKDPVKLLQVAAKRFGVKNLVKRSVYLCVRLLCWLHHRDSKMCLQDIWVYIL